SAKCMPECRTFFKTVEGLVAFFNKSTKRTHLLDEVVKQRLPRAVPTRWSSNSRLVHTISMYQSDLRAVFRIMSENPDVWDNDTLMAAGYDLWLSKASTCFFIMAYEGIFSETDELFRVLQNKIMYIGFCCAQIRDTMGVVERQRKEFDSFYDGFEQKCITLGLTDNVRRGDKSWDVALRELFLDPLQNPMYKATMGFHRYEDIRRLIRVHYAFNGMIYTGRQPGEDVQRNLGRNITMDNFFTSIPLAEKLLEKNLTLVGTLRQNKPDIPPVMKPNKLREKYSSKFGFCGNMTMVSYVPKKGKAVVLLSTMHDDTAVDDQSVKRKPEVIQYYNHTKSGVDTMDQMVRTYTCKRRTRRWPMVLDVATLNAFTSYTAQHPEKDYCSMCGLKEVPRDKDIEVVVIDWTQCDSCGRWFHDMCLTATQMDVRVRWNSSLYMLQSILEQKRALSVYAADYSLPATLTANQWTLMEKTAEVLAPFEELTRDVSNPTASAADVIPAITALKLSREKTTDQGVRTMKSTLLEAVETRFAEVEEEPLYSIATLVDPRYKDRFFTKSDNLRLATDNLILEVAKIERAASEEPEAAEPMRKTPRQEASSSLGSVLDEILEENQLEARSVSTSADVQVQTYLSEQTSPRKSNPLHYWKDNASRFPSLTAIATRFLCAPCTSVDSERLFSAVSNVLDEKRNRLSPDRVEMLIFLKKKLHLIVKPESE
ncbi:hypothetical protein JOQ06_023671, partial [Pogonophryne albipinna]